MVRFHCAAVIRAKEVQGKRKLHHLRKSKTLSVQHICALKPAKLAEKKSPETLAALKAGKAADVQWSPVSIEREDARKTMSEAYAALLKALLSAANLRIHCWKVCLRR